MKFSEVRALDAAGIDREVNDAKRQLMELRLQGATGQVPNPSKIHSLKKDVARLLTEASTRRNKAAVAASPKAGKPVGK